MSDNGNKNKKMHSLIKFHWDISSAAIRHKKNKIAIINPSYNIFIIFCLCLISLSVFANDTVIIPDVNLTAENQTNKHLDSYIATTHLTREEITKSPVVNLSELLKREQSIVRLTNNSGDASQTALSLRGFGDNAAANSLILVDGFPLTNPSLLAPNFNSIPLTDIDHIDIFQGSAGTLWGDQAVGGVVNIITKHPQKFFVNSIISAGSYNSYYFNTLFGNKTATDFFYKAFAVLGSTDNYRHHNQQNTGNIAAQIGKEYRHGMLSLNLQTYTDTTDFPGGLSAKQFKQNPRQAVDFNNFSQFTTGLLQLLNKQELNDHWLLETRVDHHATEGNGRVFINFNRDDELTSINPKLIGNLGNHKIILGYLGQVSDYQLLNAKVHSQASATQNNLYLQAILPWHNMFDFTVGGRSAWQDNHIKPVIGNPTVISTNRVFVSEQGISYHPSKTFSIFIRRDGNFSFPKANEEVWLPVNITSLVAQTGTSYETGIAWITAKQNLQMNLYRLDLNNEIAFNPQQTLGQPFGSFSNLDPTRRYGFTLAEKYYLTKKISLDGQFNYVNARFASGVYAGNIIPAVPTINGNLGIDFQWHEHWLLQYDLLYTGSRYASEDLANVGEKITSYWLQNFAIQYSCKSWIINFSVGNLFNQQYSTFAFYDPVIKTNTYYPAAGRNFSLTLKFNFA